MRNYEGVIIFAPNLEEESRNKVFERFKGIIETTGSINNIDEWGMRKLAYEINDFKEGYYIIVKFQAESESINELDRVAKITDQVIRHMVVKDE